MGFEHPPELLYDEARVLDVLVHLNRVEGVEIGLWGRGRANVKARGRGRSEVGCEAEGRGVGRRVGLRGALEGLGLGVLRGVLRGARLLARGPHSSVGVITREH